MAGPHPRKNVTPRRSATSQPGRLEPTGDTTQGCAGCRTETPVRKAVNPAPLPPPCWAPPSPHREGGNRPLHSLLNQQIEKPHKHKSDGWHPIKPAQISPSLVGEGRVAECDRGEVWFLSQNETGEGCLPQGRRGEGCVGRLKRPGRVACSPQAFCFKTGLRRLSFCPCPAVHHRHPPCGGYGRGSPPFFLSLSSGSSTVIRLAAA